MARPRLLVGTRKGAFIYTGDEARRTWEISSPVMPGWTVQHMAVDTRRETPRLYAASSHWAWGPSVARSDDLGATWEQRSPGLAFPQDTGLAVSSVWHVAPGRASEPGAVYAGTQPAGLFRSEDWGETWFSVDSVNRHPYRPHWGPTGSTGGSSLHSIEFDPRSDQRFYISISSGGSYVTSDGGETWDICSHHMPTNRMATQMMKDFAKRYPQFGDVFAPPELPPNVDPAAADEMHKLRVDAANPGRLWGQAHIGVFRSDDGGDSWHDVTMGLPSFHGFPLGVSRTGTNSVWVVPLAFEDDNFRVVRGQFAVWRSRDDGASWQSLTEGLPGPDDYQSVYREGLDTDAMTPEGVYVGTSNGQVYASADGGDHWQRLPGTLPPVVSVTAAYF